MKNILKKLFKRKVVEEQPVDARIFDIETRCEVGGFAIDHIRYMMQQYGKSAAELMDDIAFVSHPKAKVSFEVRKTVVFKRQEN